MRYYSPIATQHTKATEMNATEVKALRASANAAYNAGDMSKFEAIMAQLHGHYVSEAEGFIKSDEGKKHMASLANKFD